MNELWKNKLLWVGLILLALVSFGVDRALKPPAPSGIGTVARADLLQRVTVAGSVVPFHKTVISAPYNGYVRKLYVQIGDRVREGDPVVSMAESLKNSGEEIFPMRAPFAGTVVQVLRNEGEYVDTNTPQLVRIDDLTKLFVEANAPEVEVGKLQLGQEAMVKASAILSRSYKGKIEHISLAAKDQKDWDKSRVEFPVVLEVTDPDSNLKPGMTVIVDVITSKVNGVLTLRQEYVQKDGDNYFVVTEAGQKKQIQVGMRNEDAFEIKSGLSEGERIRQVDFLSAPND